MRQKRAVLLAVALLFVASQTTFALGDNSNEQGQAQGQGQIGINRNQNDLSNRNLNDLSNRNQNQQGQMQGQGQGQAQGQGQGQMQGQVATGGDANQGQAQGQIAAQGNEQGTSVEVGGDDNDYRAYAFAPPALNAEKGTEPLNAYSIFGGIGISNTEEYQIAIEKINVVGIMMDAGLLTKEEARVEALEAFEQLKEASKSKRVLGLLWKTRGRHLGNLLGLLSMEDLRGNKDEKEAE